MKPAHTKSSLVCVPLIVMFVIIGYVVVPWVFDRGMALGLWWGTLSAVSGTIWMVVLWWATHHLVFQIAAFFKHGPSALTANEQGAVHFVILYLTCNDFQPDCCESCVQQDYPPESYRVVICDDSTDDFHQNAIDRFQKALPQVYCVQRPERKGFKAGNLNHAFQAAVKQDEEWIVLVDADQYLPRNFLADLSRVITSQAADVAFVQARHDAQHFAPKELSFSKSDATFFQRALSYEIRMFSERDLPLRQIYGFLPFLGHGGAIRRTAWLELNGFPEVVSEDYAFTMRLREAGYYGVVAENLVSWESFPKDYGAFIVRLNKFAGGAAQLFRQAIPAFWKSDASLVEKYDLCMLLSWYPLMSLVMLNGFLSALVCHTMWRNDLSVLHPFLPYLFLLMLLLGISVSRSVAHSMSTALRYWFWATAVYTAALPTAGWQFIVHLFINPNFPRTPKGTERSPSFTGTASVTFLLGIAAMWLACKYWSPFSPILLAQSVAYLSFPAFRWLNEPNWRGVIARIILFIPGMLLIVGLALMWWWARM